MPISMSSSLESLSSSPFATASISGSGFTSALSTMRNLGIQATLVLPSFAVLVTASSITLM